MSYFTLPNEYEPVDFPLYIRHVYPYDVDIPKLLSNALKHDIETLEAASSRWTLT